MSIKDIQHNTETCAMEEANYYKIDSQLLSSEIKFLSNCQIENRPTSAVELCKWLNQNNLADVLPTFHQIVEKFAVIPVTSCSAERSFSCLRRMKTYLRNTMGQQRLSSLATISIQRNIANRVLREDVDLIIDRFANKPGRNTFLLICEYLHQ